jgi:hypothetical protein
VIVRGFRLYVVDYFSGVYDQLYDVLGIGGWRQLLFPVSDN